MPKEPATPTPDELLLRELLDECRELGKQLFLMQRRILLRLGPKPKAPKQIEFTSPTGKKRTITYNTLEGR